MTRSSSTTDLPTYSLTLFILHHSFAAEIGNVIVFTYRYESLKIFYASILTKFDTESDYTIDCRTVYENHQFCEGKLDNNELTHINNENTTLSLRFSIYVHPTMKQKFIEENKHSEHKLKLLESVTEPGTQQLARIPSPRFIKTHLPLSLLPPKLLETSRVVYVARDPRDVAVSFYHLNRLMRTQGYVGDFKTYWNYFIRDLRKFMHVNINI